VSFPAFSASRGVSAPHSYLIEVLSAVGKSSRLAAQKSVLDYVTDSLSRLQGRLGTADKRKLDEYMESVRDIERRIQLAEEQNGQTQLPLMDRPSSIPQDYEQYARLMIDLLVVAWQSDMTRVASFMLGRKAATERIPRSASLTSPLDLSSPGRSSRSSARSRRIATS
jgi:hypothetical protein